MKSGFNCASNLSGSIYVWMEFDWLESFSKKNGMTSSSKKGRDNNE